MKHKAARNSKTATLRRRARQLDRDGMARREIGAALGVNSKFLAFLLQRPIPEKLRGERPEADIRDDLQRQLEAIYSRWQRRLAEDRRIAQNALRADPSRLRSVADRSQGVAA